MILNRTPVRTCKNYKINDISLEEELPKKVKQFENVKITQETGKDEVTTNAQFQDFNIKFGSGIVNQIKEQANQKIRININSKTNKDINVEFDFDEKNTELIENIEIIGEENTTSVIYIIYRNRLCEEVNPNCKDLDKRCSGVECAQYKTFHNGLIRVLVKANANMTVNIINLMNGKSTNVLSIDGKIKSGAKLKYNIVDFGGEKSITNLYTNLEENQSNNSINTIYLRKEKEIIDLNYIAECFGEKSNINMNIQGALKDEAIKHFKGTIDFKKGCKKAIGNESENCMLLSDKVKSLALPILLCSEEDVEGNHSASSGKADEKELFYIMTRGFDRKAAERLLVRAKFNKILEGISNSEIRQEISYEIEQRLN